MKQTYNEALQRVYQDEGGYSNTPGDSGGPTNYGITIWDARKYWKADASASDVRSMPQSVAADIYRKHYADTINYDALPPGVDYAVLDYSINSGVGRGLKIYNSVKTADPIHTINAIYDERVAFLNAISKKPGQAKFLKGWLSRCSRGRVLALNLNKKYSNTNHKNAAAGAIILTGSAATTQTPHHVWPYLIAGTITIALVVWLYMHFTKGK